MSTLSWHERSLVPERQWDGAYRWLLAQLRQRGAYVAPARDVVSWFSARRSVDLQGAEVEADRLQALADRGPETAAFACLMLRIHGSPPDRDGAGASDFVDIPVDSDSLTRTAFNDPGDSRLNGPEDRPRDAPRPDRRPAAVSTGHPQLT